MLPNDLQLTIISSLVQIKTGRPYITPMLPSQIDKEKKLLLIPLSMNYKIQNIV